MALQAWHPSFTAYFCRDQDVQKKAEVFTARTIEAWLVLHPETHVLRVCCTCEAVSIYQPGLENRFDRPWDECIPCGPMACKIVYATTAFETAIGKGDLYPIRCCWCWRLGSCIKRRSRSCGHASCCECDSPHSRTFPDEMNPATKWAIEDMIRSSVVSTLQARNTPIPRKDSATLGKISFISRSHAPCTVLIDSIITPNPLRSTNTWNLILHRRVLCNDIETAG